jgi:hypothetical protein
MEREERQRMWSAIARGEATLQVMKRGRIVKVPWPSADQLKASITLGRAQGDFIERHEHKVTGVVEVVLPDNGRGDA